MQHESPDWAVVLLPEFECRFGRTRVQLPVVARQLMVRLSVARPGGVGRTELVDDLGLAGAADARARLRKTLWLINHHAGRDAVAATRADMRLADAVQVDLDAARGWCRRLVACGLSRDAVLSAPPWLADAVSMPLLPGWDADWLAPAQQEWDVLRLETLQALAEAELHRGNVAAALVHAESLVRADPLRESAWFTLLTALLLTGRRAAAARRYRELSDLLRREIGLAPATELRRLLAAAS